MQLLSDGLSELVRLVIGLAAIGALVWICGRMPRTYVVLKIIALTIWGAMSFGIPAFVFLAMFVPQGKYWMGVLSVGAAGACMVWPFMRFGWPALRDALRPGATQRP